MSGRKNILIISGFVLSASLISSVIVAVLISNYYNKLQFSLLNVICSEVLNQEPEAKKIVSAALKECTRENASNIVKDDILSTFGYHISDLPGLNYKQNILLVTTGVLSGTVVFLFTFLYRNKIEARRIQALEDYLEQASKGKAAILSVTSEDVFSKLEDAIYKNVTFLYQTKDAAVQAKNDFAQNLSNIAHQIKTPITAISLSIQIIQTMQKEYNKKQLEQIQKQLLRLSRLEEALLVLAQLDAGTLALKKEQVDVFTILVIAADNLQELLAGTSIDIPELGEMAIIADLDWTVEAVINLMKNCIEHSAGGTIHCSYGQNLLYTEILIWDEGDGFAKEDIPHIFERFYRGQNACEGGIGIGLSLAKEIIERQNGTIRAVNMPNGGACFEIRFYCH